MLLPHVVQNVTMAETEPNDAGSEAEVEQDGELGDPNYFAEHSALTPSGEEWETQYTLDAEPADRLLRHLAKVDDWAVIEFHPRKITGMSTGGSLVSVAKSVVESDDIRSSGSHWAAAVNVGDYSDTPKTFLEMSYGAEFTVEPVNDRIRIYNGQKTISLDISHPSYTRVEPLPNEEYETVAEMQGWQFTGAFEGVQAASKNTFSVQAVNDTDLRVEALKSGWSHEIEDVVEATEFGKTKLGELFFPEICDAIDYDDDVVVRFAENWPLEVNVNGHTRCAVAPRIKPEDREEA